MTTHSETYDESTDSSDSRVWHTWCEHSFEGVTNALTTVTAELGTQDVSTIWDTRLNALTTVTAEFGTQEVSTVWDT